MQLAPRKKQYAKLAAWQRLVWVHGTLNTTSGVEWGLPL